MIGRPSRIVLVIGSTVCALAYGIISYVIIENKKREPFKDDAKKIDI